MFKTVKKLTAFLLILVLLLPVFSCGNNNTKNEQTVKSGAENSTENIENTEEPVKLTDGLPDIDMQGYEFNIFNFDETWFTWRHTRILSEEQDGDIVNDALYIRQTQIEDRFTCSLKVVEVDQTTPYIKKNVSSGDGTYQLYSVYDQDFGGSVSYMIDCNTVPYLKLNEKHWNPDATQLYDFSGKQLALAGNISLGVISGSGCIAFNKKIYQNYFAGESLYDLVRDNKWTMDKYFEITASVGRDLNGDGAWDANDLYAVSSNFMGIIGGLLSCAGMGFTETGEDGIPVFNLHHNEAALNLLSKLMDAFNTPGYNYNTATAVYDHIPDLFQPGQALFALTSAHGVDKLRVMDDDIGILPYPKYSESQERYYATTYGNTLWILPKTIDAATEGEYIGIILEAMSFSGYYDIIPQYKEIVLKTKSARDDESADMLDIIFDSVTFTFDMNILFDSTLQTTILPAMFKDKSSGSIVSICDKNSAAIGKYIDKFYKAVDAID